MSKPIEENLREYLYCKPSSIARILSKGDTDFHGLTTQNQIKGVFDNLESDRDRLAVSSYLRETESTACLEFLDGLGGVIVEFGVENGTDVFAGYSDRTAAWYDCTKLGMLEVVLKDDTKLESILLSAKKISDLAKPSNSMPIQPSAGFTLISLISAEGIYFGLGQSRIMAADSICGPIIKAALTFRKEILSLA